MTIVILKDHKNCETIEEREIGLNLKWGLTENKTRGLRLSRIIFGFKFRRALVPFIVNAPASWGNKLKLEMRHTPPAQRVMTPQINLNPPASN